jgi:hypothetical protein
MCDKRPPQRKKQKDKSPAWSAELLSSASAWYGGRGWT